jgi:hypothetical protein
MTSQFFSYYFMDMYVFPFLLDVHAHSLPLVLHTAFILEQCNIQEGTIVLCFC